MMRPVPNVNVLSEPAYQPGQAAADAYTNGPWVLAGRPAAAAHIIRKPGTGCAEPAELVWGS